MAVLPYLTSAQASCVSLRTTLVGMSGEGSFLAFALRSLRNQSMSSLLSLRSIKMNLRGDWTFRRTGGESRNVYAKPGMLY
jgi:hypothetical protein